MISDIKTEAVRPEIEIDETTSVTVLETEYYDEDYNQQDFDYETSDDNHGWYSNLILKNEFMNLQRQLLPEKKPSNLTFTKMTSGRCLPATFVILEPRADTRHSVILRPSTTKMTALPTLVNCVGSQLPLGTRWVVI